LSQGDAGGGTPIADQRGVVADECRGQAIGPVSLGWANSYISRLAAPLAPAAIVVVVLIAIAVVGSVVRGARSTCSACASSGRGGCDPRLAGGSAATEVSSSHADTTSPYHHGRFRCIPEDSTDMIQA